MSRPWIEFQGKDRRRRLVQEPSTGPWISTLYVEQRGRFGNVEWRQIAKEKSHYVLSRALFLGAVAASVGQALRNIGVVWTGYPDEERFLDTDDSGLTTRLSKLQSLLDEYLAKKTVTVTAFPPLPEKVAFRHCLVNPGHGNDDGWFFVDHGIEVIEGGEKHLYINMPVQVRITLTGGDDEGGAA
jgi:hypothetical protein